MNRLDDKVAIITGGARGQGASEAELFLQAGADVFITDIDAKFGRETADRFGPKCCFVEQDVSSEDSWTFLVDIVLECQGRIDVLVNNAGLFRVGGLATNLDPAVGPNHRRNPNWRILGDARGAAAMKKNGSGSIINISSSAGLSAAPGGARVFGRKMGRTRNVEVCRSRVGPLWNSRKLGSSRIH